MKIILNDYFDYQIGDEVTIREDIDCNMNIPNGFTEWMREYRGISFTISKVVKNKNYISATHPFVMKFLDENNIEYNGDTTVIYPTYRIDKCGKVTDDNDWVWNAFMFKNLWKTIPITDPEELSILYDNWIT